MNWCVYGWFLKLWGIGKIISEQPGVVFVEYSDNSILNAWNPDWIKRFETLEEAVEYYLEKRLKNSNLIHKEIHESEIWEYIHKNFPSYFKNILEKKG